MNFFDNFNLSELSWSTTSWSQCLNFCQWWDKTEKFCTALLNMIFNYSLSIIEIRMIFVWLVENLAEFLSKSVFKSASQLLYWITVLLYVSFDISDELILILLWSDRDAEQSELLFMFVRIIEFSWKISDLLLLEVSSHSSNFKEVLHCFISCWKHTCSVAEIASKIK